MQLEAWQINGVAVVVAGIAQFVLGWVWYMPGVFGRRWLSAQGMTAMPQPGPKLVLYLVGAIVTACVIAIVLSWAGGASIGAGVAVGVLLALPIVAMETTGVVMGRPASYVLIQDGYALAGFALMGAIIGALG